MIKKIYRVGLMGIAVLAAFTSCSDEQQFTNEKHDAKKVDVQVLNADLAISRPSHCSVTGHHLKPLRLEDFLIRLFHSGSGEMMLSSVAVLPL